MDLLNEREIRMLRLASQGKNRVQIASSIHRCPDSVKKYFREIREKLNAINITQAITIAARRGIIDFNDGP